MKFFSAHFFALMIYKTTDSYLQKCLNEVILPGYPILYNLK